MQNLTKEQQDKVSTLEQLSASFLQMLLAEEGEIDDEAQGAMNSLSVDEEDLEATAKEVTEVAYCLNQARARMKEACMWATRAVKRSSGDY